VLKRQTEPRLISRASPLGALSFLLFSRFVRTFSQYNDDD